MEEKGINELLESYLDGALSEEEQKVVEERLKTDDSFKAQLELTQKLRTAYQPGYYELRKAIDAIDMEKILSDKPDLNIPNNKRPPFLLIGLGFGFLFFFVLYLFFYSSDPQKPQGKDPLKPVADIPDDINSRDYIVEDFSLNQNFESDILNGNRRGNTSEKADLKLKIPISNQTFYSNSTQEVNLDFSGGVDFSTLPANTTSLSLLIFNNKDDNTPIQTIALPLTQIEANSFSFQIKPKLNLNYGLYYFTIDDAFGNQLKIGKFQIK